MHARTILCPPIRTLRAATCLDTLSNSAAPFHVQTPFARLHLNECRKAFVIALDMVFDPVALCAQAKKQPHNSAVAIRD